MILAVSSSKNMWEHESSLQKIIIKMITIHELINFNCLLPSRKIRKKTLENVLFTEAQAARKMISLNMYQTHVYKI